MKVEDLARSIELDIENYENKISVKNVGYVLQSGDGIVRIYGLSNIMSGELITFSKPNVYAMALNLEERSVGAVLFGESEILKEGDEAYGSGRLFTVPVGESILGRVVSPLGEALDGGAEIVKEIDAPIENEAPHMFSRFRVSQSLQTGIKAIDGMIPIGKGQRELIIGDRHTGKTSIAIDTIINQRDKNVISVYVAIGQRRSSVARIVETLKENNALANTVVVMASADEAASLQFLAPYAGCAIAEYFMQKGRDVLIVYDDLSKHAVAYREISLLLRRPPGREAYPGDIFYIHSRLLERAAMLAAGGSMTALPIVETLAGDLSAYIPTNIISITDGQIYLESGSFNSGIRPAINAGLSVSRVGGAAQCKAMKQVASPLKIALAQYREVASFSQLSSDIDISTKKQLRKGERFVEALKQGRNAPLSIPAQVVLFYALLNGFLDELSLHKIADFEGKMVKFLQNHKDLEQKILSDDGIIDEFRVELDDFVKMVLENV